MCFLLIYFLPSHHQGSLVAAQVGGGALLGHVGLFGHLGFLLLLFNPVESDLQDQTLQEVTRQEVGAAVVSLPVEPTIQPVCLFVFVATYCLKLPIYMYSLYLSFSIVYLFVYLLALSFGWNDFLRYLQVMPAAGCQLFPVGQEVEWRL